ncbi:hypothetical protein I553_1050 [Mycobacterium xenopi 4042]|uniref:Uncharacterized protein n=1 Tax=Mycobacterium xenopi 4042 TaxID=1299334 RepID=X7ZBV4_MYCXE|nr:hypothetical protein I553_1050 [Mycobacterium xenopi 4042]
MRRKVERRSHELAIPSLHVEHASLRATTSWKPAGFYFPARVSSSIQSVAATHGTGEDAT